MRLAAGHAFGISRNHPFVDGHERTRLVVAELFLESNGCALIASDPDPDDSPRTAVSTPAAVARERPRPRVEFSYDANAPQARRFVTGVAIDLTSSGTAALRVTQPALDARVK